MCPSYMVTLDEKDTTRARANMLRSVIEGTLPLEELTGQRMKEVMDLCVGCKACKTECPSRVDVASMKTEVLYQTGKEHGFSLRQKAAGHIRSQLALAALLPSFYNAVAGTRLARRAAGLAGIDPRRSLPRVTNKTFSKRFPSLPQGEGPAEVALFNDTWNEYQRPEVGVGAVRLLAGDDNRNLLPDDERVALPAEATRLFEEALLELGPELPLHEGSPVLLHGHCHQKALVGTGPTERALSLVSGADVEVVDSGCCGMAGLFGYERDHYEVSMKMGERRLFPAVRGAERRVVVAPGTSCREQILGGTGPRCTRLSTWRRCSPSRPRDRWRVRRRRRCGSCSATISCSSAGTGRCRWRVPPTSWATASCSGGRSGSSTGANAG